MQAFGAAGDAALVGDGDEELDGGEVEVEAGGAWGRGCHDGPCLGRRATDEGSGNRFERLGMRCTGPFDFRLIERGRQLRISRAPCVPAGLAFAIIITTPLVT